jgi:hypothetical protein
MFIIFLDDLILITGSAIDGYQAAKINKKLKPAVFIDIVVF